MPYIAVRKAGLFDWLMLIGCTGTLIVSTAGALIYAADSINLAAPYWLAGGTAMLVLIAIRQRRGDRWLAGWAAALLIAFAACAGLRIPPSVPSAPAATSTDRLRLISFNMFKDNPDPAKAARWIASRRPDFVIVLEASSANLAALRAAVPSLGYAYGCSAQYPCSTVILSRYPAMAVTPLAQGDAEDRRALSAVQAQFAPNAHFLALTAVHLSRPWPLGEQRDELARLADSQDLGNPARIVAGDFNNTFATFALARFGRETNLRAANRFLPTWPAGLTVPELLAIDQVFTAPCISEVAVTRGPDLGSDHRPLVTDFSLAGCPSRALTR